jgi:flavorubredoxin
VTESNPLPRELAPHVFWLGECVRYRYGDVEYHGYASLYLISGDHASLLVETGSPADVSEIERQLDAAFAAGAAPLRYIFTTHNEAPHAGGLGRLLTRYPDATVVGEISDYHLVFPQFTDRLQRMAPGDSIDLGGTEFRIIEAVFRDYLPTLWGFDSASRTLFPGDGFAYSHVHSSDQCGRVAEEVPALDLVDMTAMYSEFAFYWTKFVDIEPYVQRLDTLVRDELAAEIVAPTHGLPITDVARTLPIVFEGMRAGSVRGAASGI